MRLTDPPCAAGMGRGTVRKADGRGAGDVAHWPLRQRFALPPPHRYATGRIDHCNLPPCPPAFMRRRMPAPLDHIDSWIFDLDNTLYAPSARLFD